MKIWRRDDDFPPQIELYRLDDLKKFEIEAKLARDRDEISANKKLIEALAVRGQMRDLMTMRPTFREDLEGMRARFPNFGEVIDYVRRCAEIAWRTDKVLRFNPILLNGAGGVGKTMFSEALAAWMNHGFHRISISSSQNGAELAGSSSFFSNCKPGVPFNSLVHSDHANPVIFLDEIDKNTTATYDALGALYVLLEPTTARNYKDQCFSLPIDVSGLLWLAASNDSEQIHSALRSRFVEFQISITPDQSRIIAESIVAATLRSLSPATDGMTFAPSAIETLSEMTPRKIRQAAFDAIGHAFVNETMLIDAVSVSQPAKRRIGFIS